jgi:hypothetical protein
VGDRPVCIDGGNGMTFEIEIDDDLLIISKTEDRWNFWVEPTIWVFGSVFVGLQVIKGQLGYHLNSLDVVELLIGTTLGLLMIGLGTYKQEWKLDKKTGYASKTFHHWYGREEYKYEIDQLMEFETIEKASGVVDIIFPNLMTSDDVSATQSRSLVAVIGYFVYPKDFSICGLRSQVKQQTICALNDFFERGSDDAVDSQLGELIE